MLTLEMKVCPNHNGSFDCTPFCRICEGNQEYESNGYLPCNRFGECGVSIPEDIWHEELGFCQPCQEMYFNQQLDPFTLEKLECEGGCVWECSDIPGVLSCEGCKKEKVWDRLTQSWSDPM